MCSENLHAYSLDPRSFWPPKESLGSWIISMLGSRLALCKFIKVKVQEVVYDVINRVHCTVLHYNWVYTVLHCNYTGCALHAVQSPSLRTASIRRPEYATTGASPLEVTAVCECCAPGGGTGPTVRSLSAHKVVGYSSVHAHTDIKVSINYGALGQVWDTTVT